MTTPSSCCRHIAKAVTIAICPGNVCIGVFDVERAFSNQLDS